MSPLPSPPTSLIGKCLRRSGPKQRGKILESYAAEVVIACRILGPRAAGKSLGEELFGETVTATPILKVVAMVESREIPVTKEQLLAIVQQDESAMRYYESNPWIIDPTGETAPQPKKGRKLAKEKLSSGWTPQPVPVANAEKSGRTPAMPTASPTKTRTEAESPALPADPVFVPTDKADTCTPTPNKKRRGVEKPPLLTPADYIPKPSEPLQIRINKAGDD